MITLFPKQVEVVDQMQRDLMARQYSFVIAGRSSGKSIIAHSLADRQDYAVVVILGAEPEAARQLYSEHLRQQLRVSPNVRIEYSIKYVMHELVGDALVIMEEPLATRGSYEQFKTLREMGCHVVAIGASGPEYAEDKRWSELVCHRYEDSELNPRILADADVLK